MAVDGSGVMFMAEGTGVAAGRREVLCAPWPDEGGLWGTIGGGGIDALDAGVVPWLAFGGAGTRRSGACEACRASLPKRGRGFATGLKTVPPSSVNTKHHEHLNSG